MTHPDKPNSAMNDAVLARQEIDLRLGAAFTRFQTLRLQGRYEGLDSMISYGPCQFPTLGFVIERYLKIEAFRPEDFWSIALEYEGPDPDSTNGTGTFLSRASVARERHTWLSSLVKGGFPLPLNNALIVCCFPLSRTPSHPHP